MGHLPKISMKKTFKMIGIKANGVLKCDDYKKIVDFTVAWLKLEFDITVKIADIDRGKGYFNEKKIILPAWLDEYDVAYQVYYVIHELAHCLLGYKHDESYKKAEDFLLSLWCIQIVRKRVYPKKLFLEGIEIYNLPANQALVDLLETKAGVA
jgi:hypothetical protein